MPNLSDLVIPREEVIGRPLSRLMSMFDPLTPHAQGYGTDFVNLSDLVDIPESKAGAALTLAGMLPVTKLAKVAKRTRTALPMPKAARASAATDPWRDMTPGAETQGMEPSLVPAPRMGESWYHGRRGDITFSEERPAFFARSRSDAEWYAQERGNRKATPTVGEYQLGIRKPARLRDLHDAVTEAGATAKDVEATSGYDAEDLINYLYVPKVREALKRKGFDGFVGWDTLEQNDIQIAVPFSTKQINR